MFWRKWLGRRADAERDLDEEVRSWFDIQAARNESRGMPPDEARRNARAGFFGPEQVKQQVRESRANAWIEALARDIRYSLRALRKNPAFTLVAVSTLALGIGANTAIFSLIDAIMLRELPVAEPHRLMLLTDPAASGVSTESNERGARTLLAYDEFQELRARSTVFTGLFAAQSAPQTSDIFPVGGAHSRRARVQLVSGEFFEVLGLHPSAGRFFGPTEDRVRGGNNVCVISRAFWQREFAAAGDSTQQTLHIGNGAFRIIGIAPAGFRGIEAGAETDIWVPLTMQAQVSPGRDFLTPRDTLWLQVMGRLRQGISYQAAEASVSVTLQEILHDWHSKDLHQTIRLRPGATGASDIREQFGSPLLLLMAMVGLVLLIACANIAILLLARAGARQREIAVRIALGAARTQLIRQILMESAVLAAVGGMAGALVAWLGTRALLSFVSAWVDGLSLDVHGDSRVLLFTAAASILTAVAFGLLPALRETRIAGNQRGTQSANLRGGRVLVVLQIALSLILVTSAALLSRSLRNNLNEKVGFDRDHLLQAVIDPPAAGYRGAALTALYSRITEQLRLTPGTRDATVAAQSLFGGGDSQDRISLDRSLVSASHDLRSRWTLVAPNYFSTLGIPLLRGRQIGPSDAARDAQVCVVNETFANRFFPGSDPIGSHVTDEYPTTRQTCEIVGVAADAKEHRPAEEKTPRFYAPLYHPIGTYQRAVVLLRTTGDPALAAAGLRAAIAQISPGLPIASLRTVDEQLGRALITRRILADLSGLFGLVGLFLAAIGIYGVMSYSTSRRKGEIGVRMALGASGGNVTGMVLRDAFRMVITGTAIGIPCALAAGRSMGSLLYGLGPADPAALGVSLAVITVVAVAAAYLPARRAARTDPMNALRCD